MLTALPELVDRLLLFGSRAHGEANRNSDCDVAVLLKGNSRPDTIRTVLSDMAYRHVRAGMAIRPLAAMEKPTNFAARVAIRICAFKAPLWLMLKQ